MYTRQCNVCHQVKLTHRNYINLDLRVRFLINGPHIKNTHMAVYQPWVCTLVYLCSGKAFKTNGVIIRLSLYFQ